MSFLKCIIMNQDHKSVYMNSKNVRSCCKCVIAGSHEHNWNVCLFLQKKAFSVTVELKRQQMTRHHLFVEREVTENTHT